MVTRRGWVLLGAGVGLVSLTGASLAWACGGESTPLAPSVRVTTGQTEGSAGTSVPVSVTQVNAIGTAGDPVRIIWEDAQANRIPGVGDLATVPTQNGTTAVSMTVKIPDAPPGVYLLGVYRGATYGGSPAAFTITNPNPNAAPSTPSHNFGSPDGTSFGGFTSGATSDAAAASSAAASAVHRAVTQPVALGAGSAAGGLAAIPSAAALGSSAPAAGSQSSAPTDAVSTPSSKVLGNLWGGFAHGQTASQAPSLIENQGSGLSPQLFAGLAVGAAAAMLAGFFATEVARRRSRSIGS